MHPGLMFMSVAASYTLEVHSNIMLYGCAYYVATDDASLSNAGLLNIY